mmetsp:Transcript_35914/g.58045  ORF Transcript_35914/g.58045 Transcript_35914/m.58045 type:complete len:213 (+) Transcript_35914:232-870(+)|eukprot:CAMPEP_0184648040 /NCGR_PEP_ID=MMETSP0308-20130426/5072_1 /TAXON_ID=38269 /ORGANISM="Gloeochaete witrockiana, Strain SAG 46.84" /LENGTH=212 /DNA_ID=CAMNT_0027079543 /DNA_START=251 /DNA_END=889 /DNA_ORIENTATION=-
MRSSLSYVHGALLTIKLKEEPQTFSDARCRPPEITCLAKQAGQKPGRRLFVPGAPNVQRLPLRVIRFSKGREVDFDTVASEFSRRLQFYTSFEEKAITPATGDRNHCRKSDAQTLFKHISLSDALVVLDETGKDVDSHQLASMLTRNDSRSLTFCIGGPWGLDKDEIKAHANDVKFIRLSSLTLNHEIARVVLLEALYRSYTILLNENYHHD